MASDTLTSVAPVHRFILLTDIAQSSRLAEQYGKQYLNALEQHNKLVEQVVAARSGEVYKQTGDGYLVLFETAGACLEAALELGEALGKLALAAENEPLQVRLALHAGELKPSGPEYFGPALNRVSRICQVCNPGQVLLSAAVKATLPRALDGFELRDLGEHHLRDLAEPEQLYQLDSERFSRHEFPPLSTLDNRPNNLVEQPNAFIGRERELSELAELLLASKRLVSITAPGGYGKSRLAAQLCANLLHRFEHGVFMVYLAPVREILDVPTAIANALGYQFSGSREPQQQLCDYLREKELLLCLDNFEHVLDSAPLAARLIAAAPKLKAVITSREALRVKGEYIFPLEPLPIVATGAEQYSEAVRLFVDRAALVKHGYTINADNAAQIQHFCGHLAGIPLAIELAAAWMDGFTLEELHQELTSQLELEARISGGPARHHSLTACLDWSWGLLGAEQQDLVMRLAPFRGGFFSEAASAVLSLDGMRLRSALLKLCDKSWLYSREVEGQTRFFLRDMLVSDYAFTKLAETRGQEDSLFEQAVGAHAAYFAEFAKREGPRLEGGGTPDGGTAQRQAVRAWRLELENVSEALDTALHRQNLDWLLPIAAHLARYLEFSSAFFMALERYSTLHVAAVALGDSSLLLQAKLGLGRMLWLLGRSVEAKVFLEDSRDIAVARADHLSEVTALTNLGVVHFLTGDSAHAAEYYAQALALARQIGDRRGEISALVNLANVRNSQGDNASAEELYRQGLQICREFGNRFAEANTLGNWGCNQYTQGEIFHSAELHHQALALKHELGDRAGVAISSSCSAAPLAALGEYRSAAVSLHGSQRYSAEIGYRFDPVDQKQFDEARARLDSAVDSGEITAEQLGAWQAEGESLKLDELVSYVLTALENAMSAAAENSNQPVEVKWAPDAVSAPPHSDKPHLSTGGNRLE